MERSKVGFIKFNASLMNDYELKIGEALVYGALVSFRNMSIQSSIKDEQGHVYAYPSISSIAKITGQSERSVKSHIKVLEGKGLMSVKRTYKEGSKEKNVNRYYLNIEVLKVYFSVDVVEMIKKAKPKTTVVKETFQEMKQRFLITDTNIERWFTSYGGEHNDNSAKKLNQSAAKYGAETVVKAIHNAMEGVDVTSLSKGSTGFILSKLNEKNLEHAKCQLQNEREKRKLFMNEPSRPLFDYTKDLKRKKSKKIRTGF